MEGSQNLERVDDSVQKLNNKQRWHLALDDCNKVDTMPEHADKVVMRCGDHRWDVFRLGGTLLCLKEVVAHRAADNALPMLFQEDIS